MLTESVIKLLKNEMWDLATCSDGEPNVVPVAFKDVTEDGKLVVGDVFIEKTKVTKMNAEMYIDLGYTSLHFLYGKTLINFIVTLSLKSMKVYAVRWNMDLQECWMIQSWWHLYIMFLCILNIRGRK